MPKVSQRAKLVLTSEQVQQLAQLAHSRTAPHRDVQRARMLCHYQEGRTFTEIAALRDRPHGKQPQTIMPEDKVWVVHLACTKPRELGYAAELWTRRTLAEHIRKVARPSGHPDRKSTRLNSSHRCI